MPKMSSYTLNATPVMTDELIMVDDPAGTPATKTLTLQALANLIRSDNLVYAGRTIKQIDTTASETSMAPSIATGSLTLAANYLTQGKTMRLRISGTIDSTGSPTLTFKFKIGATTYLTSAAITVGADYNDVMFHMEVDWTIWTTGATGTLAVQGRIFIGTTVVPFSATGWAALDTTASKLLAATAQWSASSADNVLNISNYTVEAVN
jgi:hypothetical protein